MPSDGQCEVLVYTADHETELPYLPLEDVLKVIRLWRERFSELERQPHVQYVLIFENRGAAVGVTLSHPHGQLYAFPMIPSIIQRELVSMKTYSERNGTCLLCDAMEAEGADGRRIVTRETGLIAYVPFWGRWPYEVHILPDRHLSALTEMDEEEMRALASILPRILRKYDSLMGSSMPYVVVLHQRPTDGRPYPFYHFHVEVYPMKRSSTELKYLAGSELGAGVFINDSHPEDKARELREAP